MDQDYGTQIDKPGFHERLTELRNALLEHMDMEENQLLPHLERNLSTDNIDSLNSWFDNVKLLAPTRPHPDGPHSAAGKLATGPIVAFVDSLRDLTKKFSE